MHIAILSTSVRAGRNSHRVGLYFKKYVEKNEIATADLIDLQDYKFPIFEERLRFMIDPSPQIVDFATRIKNADGVVVITPEYNGGFPASLKNVIDLLSVEWKRKPTGIVTVSTGAFGGVLVYPSLIFSLWKKGVWVIPARYQVPHVQEAFDENGYPADITGTEKRTQTFLQELVWCMEAREKMNPPD
ncbi:FMN reductase [Adhaeribacter arboris]|uniref:FMN reductase n=1 Tax=Adhaeribacter arboris TaxID=2072846 RepID=A0A2T2YDX5_9BACT|nr:NAD(P)H-dependent oxidoreductase [Adhaeribacter arboris]PSR53719.1 FMN reductase [Adhaeribacter arboris]